MKGKDMVIGRRYVVSNSPQKKFKVTRHWRQGNQDGYMVRMVRKGSTSIEMAFVADGIDVEPLNWGKKRAPKEQMDKVITHIKSGDWYKEQKAYIIFRIHGVVYKLYYIAQKVLVRCEIDKIKPEKQYKNGYYVYSVSDVAGYILRAEI